MIMASVNKERCSIAMNGNVFEIAGDVCKIIDGIYTKLEDDSGKNILREVFREALTKFLTDEDSPLFEAPEEKHVEVEEI